jgi:DNA-binding transcriptional regulator YbjK
MAEARTTQDANEPAWRQRAVSRSLHAARSRAEQRVQRFLDAAFELIDEKGTTDFTIQEVIDRSKQSLRGFYQYFDGKDELLLANHSPGCARSRSASTSGASRPSHRASADHTTADRSPSSACSSRSTTRAA